MDFSAFLNVLKPFEKLIGAVAPTVATALGGPLAGNAVGFLMKALDIDTPEAMAEKLQTQAPDTMLALRQIEVDYQKHLDTLGVDLERIAAGDRDSARNREIQVKDKIPAILAIGTSLGFFALITLLIFREPPAGNQALLNIMTGSLGTAWIGVMAYYFGSSAGSAAKNTIISSMTDGTANLAAKLAGGFK